ncbi:MAG: PAS domain S-box protein, partial [Methanomicrobiaceae archaeon]|nr:PAS domain S-box protein [Methanomicrobiaceae archaeon]
MDIRSKTLLIIVATFSMLIFIHLFSYSFIILGSYSQMENNIVSHDMDRVITAVGDDINHLDSVANEWSLKENLVQYLSYDNRSGSYSELNEATFERLQFNLIYIYDSSKNLVQGFEYNIFNREYSVFSEESNKIIRPLVNYSIGFDKADGIMGIITMPAGPMLFSARPIYGKEDSGYLGTIVMGRYFDEKIRERLSSITGFDVSVIYQENKLTDKMAVFKEYKSSRRPFIARKEDDKVVLTAPVEIEPLNEESLGSFILINDVYGDEAIILEVKIPREIYQTGKESTVYSIILFIVSAGILGLVVLFLLEKNVLSRIFVLSRSIDSIRKKKDSTLRVDEEGSDEISSLASNINGMLVELDESKNKIECRLNDSEERYRLFFDSAEDMVFIVQLLGESNPGRFLEVNKAMISSLGYSRDELLQMTLSDITRENKIPEGSALKDSDDFNSRFEICFRTKDARMIPFEVTAHIFNNFGTPAIMGIAREISERREIEKLKIGMIQKIEKNMEQFAILNDHLRNPLQVIMGQVLLGPDCDHDIILDQVEEINNIVKKIDQGWIESAKIRE